MTVRLADRVEFCLFDQAKMARFRRLVSALSIEEKPPATIEVPEGILAAGELPDGRRLGARGVCDGFGKIVNSSVALRGEQFGMNIRGPTAAVLSAAPDDRRSVYYLGDVRHHRGHYGHFLLDTLSRAWNWSVQDTAICPILLGNRIPAFAQEIYSRIPRLAENLSLVNRTTRFDHVTIPSPSFVIDKAAHVQFKELCEAVAKTVDRDEATDRPLYLSRAGLDPNSHRTIVGEEELEELLSREGFLVVRPETLPICEQIKMLRSHRYIVTPMGSACHSRLFSSSTKLMLVLSPDRFDANHVLCDLLSEGDTHYVNVTYAPDLMSEDLLPPYAQPLLLDFAKVLTSLKSLGLIRPSTVPEGRPPGIQEYKLRWLQTAQWFLERRESDGLRRSIELVKQSLNSGAS
jgi:hypothetical protein